MGSPTRARRKWPTIARRAGRRNSDLTWISQRQQPGIADRKLGASGPAASDERAEAGRQELGPEENRTDEGWAETAVPERAQW
jgi:hypothetical protein